MKKILRKTLMLLMIMTMMGSMLVAAEAAEQITSPYIKILKPAQASTYYQGETMSYQFSIKNPFGSWLCRPFAGIMSTSNKLIYAAQGTYMAIGSSAKPTGTFPTKELPAGTYYYVVTAMAIYPGTTIEVTGQQKTAGNTFYVRKLKAPTSLKATAGTKQVTLTWKKAAGAQKYYVYRSLKKGSGYSCIAKTSAVKYVDKTAKKGKRYYYKVRTVRTTRGTVKSGYSSTVRSATVK